MAREDCIQMVVKINDKNVLELFKNKGSELSNLIKVYGDFVVFSDDKFSWKWIATNLEDNEEISDNDYMQFCRNCYQVVAACWQYSDGSRYWCACEEKSDDFIDDSKQVNKVLSAVVRTANNNNWCDD